MHTAGAMLGSTLMVAAVPCSGAIVVPSLDGLFREALEASSAQKALPVVSAWVAGSGVAIKGTVDALPYKMVEASESQNRTVTNAGAVVVEAREGRQSPDVERDGVGSKQLGDDAAVAAAPAVAAECARSEGEISAERVVVPEIAAPVRDEASPVEATPVGVRAGQDEEAVPQPRVPQAGEMAASPLVATASLAKGVTASVSGQEIGRTADADVAETPMALATVALVAPHDVVATHEVEHAPLAAVARLKVTAAAPVAAGEVAEVAADEPSTVSSDVVDAAKPAAAGASDVVQTALQDVDVAVPVAGIGSGSLGWLRARTDLRQMDVQGPAKASSTDGPHKEVAAKKAVRDEDSSDASAAVVPGVVVPLPAAGIAAPYAPQAASEKPDVPAPVERDVPVIAKVAPMKSVGHEAKKIDSAPGTAVVAAKAEVAGVAVVAVVKQVEAGSALTRESSTTTGVGVASAVAMHGGAAAKSVAIAEVTAKTVLAAAPGSDIQTLIATPNVLEVGVASGSHGWLRVRAELGQMGEVTASLATASAGAVEGLHKELPAISAYLAGERVGVSSLVVNATEKGVGVQDTAMGAGSGAQAGNERRSPRGVDAATQAKDLQGGSGSGVEFDLSSAALPLAVYANGSGKWLSVRV